MQRSAKGARNDREAEGVVVKGMEGRFLPSRIEIWGSALSSPARSGAELRPKTALMHIKRRLWLKENNY